MDENGVQRAAEAAGCATAGGGEGLQRAALRPLGTGEANASPLSRGAVAEEEAQRREARRAAEQIRAFLNLSEAFLNPGGRRAFVLPCSRRCQDGSTFTGRQGKRLARRRR